MSVEKEVLAMLRDTYLFFTIDESLESLSDELLIQVYLRLLHVLDPNCELQDSASTDDAPQPTDALKHIHKSLRHLELLHLVGKASQLLEKKTFIRLCTALHDKITARYGTKSSLRIRKIVKAEDLSRRKKKRVNKDELPCADQKTAETLPDVERKAGGGAAAAAANGRQKSYTVASCKEQPTDFSLVVVPVKGKELARTPVRPQTSDASTGDGSNCSSPNTSASSSVHDENDKDCQPVHLPPHPVEEIVVPPPLEFDNNPVETDETAPPTDLPLTPCHEILAVNYKRTADAAAAAFVNVIPSGRQIARTPVAIKLSGDAQDTDAPDTPAEVDIENASSPSAESGETNDDVGESVLHPDCPVVGSSILLDVNYEGPLEVSRNQSDLIIKPPPGFDSLAHADQLLSSSDESVEKSPQVLEYDETYKFNNAIYCTSSTEYDAQFQETPERLPILKVTPERLPKKPKKKNDVKKLLKNNQLKANVGSDAENSSACKSITTNNAVSPKNTDKIKQVTARRIRQRATVAKESKANLSPPEIKTEVESLGITSKTGRKKKPQAISVDKDVIPALKNAVQPSASHSRSKRQRNVPTVNYCEMSIIDSPNGEDGTSADESATNKENHENLLAKDCVPSDKKVKDDVSAAADAERARPGRASKLKAKGKIASDARESAPRYRCRR